MSEILLQFNHCIIPEFQILAVIYIAHRVGVNLRLPRETLRFVSFCNENIPAYPVSEDLAGAMNEYFDRCEDALITFCGGFAKRLGPLVDFANQMKKREVESGRWNDIYPEIGAAASLIAMRADETMKEGGIPQDNTNNLMLCIGLFTYAVIACNDCFKAQDYRHLFCLAWWIYFGKILCEPVDVEEHGKGLPS